MLAASHTSTRISLVRYVDRVPALNTGKERPDMGAGACRLIRSDVLGVVILWEYMLKVQGHEPFYGHMVDNQAIVVPETFDAIRALAGAESGASASISQTDAALAIRDLF